MFAYCNNNPVLGYDPTGHWDWDTQSKLLFGATLLIAGIAILLAVPSGGFSLAGGVAAISALTTTAGATLAITGTVIVTDSLSQATIYFAKGSKLSDKEKANDKPSWVSRNDIDLGKSAQQNAGELLNNKYGQGNWKKGPRSEFNQIVKWITRGIKLFVFNWIENYLEGE